MQLFVMVILLQLILLLLLLLQTAVAATTAATTAAGDTAAAKHVHLIQQSDCSKEGPKDQLEPRRIVGPSN